MRNLTSWREQEPLIMSHETKLKFFYVLKFLLKVSIPYSIYSIIFIKIVYFIIEGFINYNLLTTIPIVVPFITIDQKAIPAV